ncbi:MAG: periplasmic heavy metal sensor [Thermodesulfobacteriota bacterium]
MSSRVKIILTISVILNFFFIGLIVGHYSGKYYMYKNFRYFGTEIGERLSPENERMLKQTMRNLHKETRDSRKKIKKSRKELSRIITAPTFDEKKYDETVLKLHNLHTQMALKLSEATKKLAKEFNQEERKVIAEILKRGHRGPHEKPGGKHRSPIPH